MSAAPGRAADPRGALVRAVYATRQRWRAVALTTLLGSGAVVCAGALLAVSGYLVSRAAQQPEILLLGVAIVGVRFFGISRAILRYLERLVSHDLAFRTLTDLRLRFFSKLVPLVPGGLPRKSDLLSRFVADADRLQDLYLRALTPPLIAALAGAIGVIAAALILPAAALVIAGILVAGGVVVPLATRRVASRAGRRQAPARAQLAGEMVEVVAGAPEIAVAGREAEWEQRVDASSHLLGRLLRQDAVAAGLASGAGVAVATGGAVAMAAVAIPAVGSGALPGVLLAALVLLALASVEAIAPLGGAAASLDAVGEAAARLEAVTKRPAPIAVAPRPRQLPPAGLLALEQVWFDHPDGPSVLRGADLVIEPGRATALLGPSGSGKSTLADLLVRFVDPNRGRVTLGGVDVRELDPDELRTAVRLGPQDTYLFATTLRDNVAIGRPGASDDQLREALALVGLGAWLATLPDDLETLVGESGTQVSGGQRQRIAAARTILSEARFLIFDEPTTHLDPESSRRLLAALCEEVAHRQGRGILVVTHERDGVAGFDRVLTLTDGSLRGSA